MELTAYLPQMSAKLTESSLSPFATDIRYTYHVTSMLNTILLDPTKEDIHHSADVH